MNYWNPTYYLLFIFALFTGCTDGNSNVEKPNILWIVSEDNSPYIGAYGDSQATTPNLDRLAERGVVYENAFATTPVCAPSRFTLITGMYGNKMGTENMRSKYPIPDFINFFPKYLRQAGYYTTNNAKKDYNTLDQPSAWDESSHEASYKNRKPGQPFFHVKNIGTTHEGQLHDKIDTLIHDPDKIPIPPYHPKTERIKKDWTHYYDQITKMDAQVGDILDKLKASGEAKNTIIFYYSDHGGVLPRSKRFMFDSGLHIPLIAYFPRKYKHLAPEKKRTDRLVSFVDFPAAVLSLAGIKPPEYMDGKAFLGEYEQEPRQYVHAYRGRMDERIDLVRAVRDKQFLYVRNFMPHRIYGQHLKYLWKAPSMQSWEEEYKQGNLNDVQQRFFETKQPEELYKISSDPYNVNNLADDPAYSDVLHRMRKVNLDWMLQIKDMGVIPEGRINTIRDDSSLYAAVREQDIPIDMIIKTANKATRAQAQDLDGLVKKLDHPNTSVRFWAATAFSVVDTIPKQYGEVLLNHRNDSSAAVQIVIAEALYKYGNKSVALEILERALEVSKIFVRLRALNTVEALNVPSLSHSLQDKLRLMMKKNDTGSSPKKYIYRSAKSLMKMSNDTLN